MSWAVEEYCEDAFVAYLDGLLPATYNVYPAWTNEDLRYPAIVVHAGESDNIGETEFNGVRAIEVQISIGTEAKAVGATSARHVNRAARDAVIEALAQTKLWEDLNALNPDGVVFSYAMIGAMKREVESEMRILMTIISVAVIAAPLATTTTTTA